ncbi:hypothetical protein BDB00DRAFT_767016, partial [Zychaea mexicana]|uniref:uncharacterized protein n=1 Tax=Zychaea mexicana TaxID=64656 RepID=UPI0022FE12A3
DLNHVDHWFKLLTDTEQMAVLYTLLQHCSQNNARFFITVLQQMVDRRHPRSRTSDLIGNTTESLAYISILYWSRRRLAEREKRLALGVL